MPTNLYGPGDNFDLRTSHVIPALMRKVHEAKLAQSPDVVVLGTGRPRREFLHVADCADGLVFVMKHYSGDEIINVGSGQEVTILRLAEQIAEAVGYDGTLRTDPSMPDGTPRKLLDVARLQALGWQSQIKLADGLADTYRWYCDHLETAETASAIAE